MRLRPLTLPVLSALAVVVLGAAPAMANPGNPMCYNDGTAQCTRIQNNNDVLNNPVINGNFVQGPAENLSLDKTGQSEFGFDEATVNFDAGNCIGVSATNNTNALVKKCSGPDPSAFGTIWDIDCANADCSIARLINKRERGITGLDLCLSGGANGTSVTIHQCGSNHQQWILPAVIG